jgi:phosphoribosylformimino-5-aminoimidazole carboxamide ribotide isomerase
VKRLAARFPGRIAVGIDARGGNVAVVGWSEQSEVPALDLARRFEDAGVAAIIYTDIDRDGVLTGVNAEATARLAEALSTPVIASGGVGGLEDLSRLKAVASAGIEGVIIGRALYDGRIEPEAALALAAAPGSPAC